MELQINNNTTEAIKKNTSSSKTKNRATEAANEADVMKSLSVDIGSIATDINKMTAWIGKRESMDSEVWEAIKETPGLSDELRYFALDLVNTKLLKEVVMNMTPEERSNFIHFKSMN